MSPPLTKCPICSDPYPCKDVRADRPNPYGWDRSLEEPPKKFCDIVPDETLEWIRSVIDHKGAAGVTPPCICGMDRVEGAKGYSVHGVPTGDCSRHPEGERWLTSRAKRGKK